jgi:hypothetical protein
MKIKGLTGKLPPYLEYTDYKCQPQYGVKKDVVYECLGISCLWDPVLKNIRVFYIYYEPIRKYILSAPKELFEVVDVTIPDFWITTRPCDESIFRLGDPDLINDPNICVDLIDSYPWAVEAAQRIIKRHGAKW